MAKKPRIKSMTGKTFIDLLDSYETEFAAWKASPPVPSLVGIYELDDAAFYADSYDERLKEAGCPYPMVYFDTDLDNSSTRAPETTVGTGYTSAVKDDKGKIRPVILMRSGVNPQTKDGHPEFAHAVRLIVLMHEMGHAEDIAKGVNYDAKTLKLDIVEAEVYAHEYVCRHAKRLNYRVLLSYYLENLQEWCETGNDVQRLSAERAIKRFDMKDLKKASSIRFMEEQGPFLEYLQRHERTDDFARKFGSNSLTLNEFLKGVP